MHPGMLTAKQRGQALDREVYVLAGTSARRKLARPAMQTFPPRLIRSLDRLPRPLAWTLVFAAIAVVCWAEYEIGYEASLAPLYLIPVILPSWTMGLRAGIVLAFVESTALTASSLLAGRSYPAAWIPVWNVLIRGTAYSVVAYLVAALRAQLDEVQRLAGTDSLTGALNRKAFFQAVRKEMERATRTAKPFSIAYVDVDDFKKINDRFGHGTGDELLRAFVSSCARHLRSSDSIGRVGGDEFALLLPETDATTCIDILTRLVSLWNTTSWNGHRMTLSVGALTCLRPSHDIEQVVQLADKLMYEVKRAGKGSMRHVVHGAWGPS